jgi:hypothetical protein
VNDGVTNLDGERKSHLVRQAAHPSVHHESRVPGDIIGRISWIARRLWSRKSSAPVIAGGLSAVIFIIQTWPWMLHMGAYGIAAPGDGTSGSALWEAMVREHLNPFAPGLITAFNAPYGLPVTWQVYIQQWPTTIIMYSLTWLSGGNGEFAYTIYVAIGFILTSASMAWLAERLTKDRAVAVITGVGLTLLPFIQIASTGHPAFVHVWAMVAPTAALWILYDRPSPWTALAVGFLGFIAMSWSGYHLLFVGVSMTAVMAGFLLAALRTSTWARHARDFSIVLGVMLAGVVAQYLLILLIGHGSNPASSLRNFPSVALIIYGARWYEYVLPDSQSILFGNDTRSFFASHLHGSNPSEATLYIGLSVGVLAICGCVAIWRGKLDASARVPFLVCGLLLFAAGAWASLPLDVGNGQLGLGVRLPTLAGLVGGVTGNWRVFSRFMLVAAIGWFFMAAGGLTWISQGGKARRAVILAVAAGAITIDLYVPNMVVSFRLNEIKPQISAAIHRLPSGILAQYPLVRGELDGYAPIYNQSQYGHPLINGFDEQPQEAFAGQLQDLSQEGTVRGLQLLHVRYVLDVNQPIKGLAPSGRVSPLLKPVIAGMYGPYQATVLEVPSAGRGVATAIPSSGFSPPEQHGTEYWQWLTKTEGKIEILTNCAVICHGQLEFDLATFGPTRDVTVRTQQGRLLAQARVSTPKSLKIPLDLSQTTSVTVRATPGPIAISHLEPKNSDPRSVSIQMRDVRWVATDRP